MISTIMGRLNPAERHHEPLCSLKSYSFISYSLIVSVAEPLPVSSLKR